MTGAASDLVRSAHVIQVFRKKNPAFFSLEKVFGVLGGFIGKGCHLEKVFLPFGGAGFRALSGNACFLLKLRADVFHVTGDVHYAVLFLPSKRTILTIHDCVFMHRSKGVKREAMRLLFLKWPVRRAASITTISENSKAEIIRYTGCNPGKIMVIPNPVQEGFVHMPKEFNTAKPVILFVGVTPNKNLERVAEALQGIECTLDIIGCPDEGQLQTLDRMGVSYNWKAGLTEDELHAKYIGADLVLFPSTYEGFGLPILEGQRIGRPVITSDLEPMKSVAGGTASLVNPLDVCSIRDGIVKVIADRSYRESLIAKGLENAKRFEPAAIAGLYLDRYAELLTSVRYGQGKNSIGLNT